MSRPWWYPDGIGAGAGGMSGAMTGLKIAGLAPDCPWLLVALPMLVFWLLTLAYLDRAVANSREAE